MSTRMRYTQAELTSEMIKLGCPSGLEAMGRFPSARVMGAIGMCEAPYSAGGVSYCDFSLVGDQNLVDRTWWYSYGGYMIRSRRDQKGTGGFRDQLALVEPTFNMKAAIEVWRAQGYGAWTTHTNRQFEAFLQDVYEPPPGVYTVVSGDSLSGIAQKFAKRGEVFDWQALAYVNNLGKPWTIFIAEKLLLPWTNYTVQPGDTLGSIAEKYGIGVTYAQVASFNKITDPNVIRPGQVLRLPRASYLDYLKAKS